MTMSLIDLSQFLFGSGIRNRGARQIYSTASHDVGDHVIGVLRALEARKCHRGLGIVPLGILQEGREIGFPDSSGIGPTPHRGALWYTSGSDLWEVHGRSIGTQCHPGTRDAPHSSARTRNSFDMRSRTPGSMIVTQATELLTPKTGNHRAVICHCD